MKTIKAWREKMHITQQQAAKVLRVPLATLRNWEQGRNQPSRFALAAIQETLAKGKP